MKILAIESSCDETAVAIIENGLSVLSSVIASQIEEQRLYGGVVPEIASRRHCENITALTSQALSNANLSLEDIDAFAVTYTPGLIGALLVGVNFAKGLSLATGKPLIPVHHIRSHIAANYLTNPSLKPPFLCLVASGGHSHIIEVQDYTKFHIIGRTRDDAAGEAYDKAARAMGFPYPGGKEIDQAAKAGNRNAYPLPRPQVDGCPFDFSFSGLKTAVINLLHHAEQKGEVINRNDLSASFQDTVCSILTEKLLTAAKEYGYRTLAIAGGVSANSELRNRLQTECKKNGYAFYLPDLALCGDNAAMVGCQAYYEYLAGNIADDELNAYASMPIDQVIR